MTAFLALIHFMCGLVFAGCKGGSYTLSVFVVASEVPPGNHLPVSLVARLAPAFPPSLLILNLSGTLVVVRSEDN